MPELTVGYLDAGERYLAALRSIGFDPFGLMWAFDESEGRFVLVLITEFVDFKGPLEISRLLISAYRHSEMFRVVDPLTIRVHSPKQPFTAEIVRAANSRWSELEGREDIGRSEIQSITADDLVLSWKWAYRSTHRKAITDRQRINQRWSFFQRNVEKLAA